MCESKYIVMDLYGVLVGWLTFFSCIFILIKTKMFSMHLNVNLIK